MPHREYCGKCGRSHVPLVDCRYSSASDEATECEQRLRTAAIAYSLEAAKNQSPYAEPCRKADAALLNAAMALANARELATYALTYNAGNEATAYSRRLDWPCWAIPARPERTGMEIWICGQLTGEWIGRGTPWEFQGAFTSEANADAACRDSSYFIFPATMDEELPHDAVDTPRARYPRVPNNPI